jgi:hypothetical protein
MAMFPKRSDLTRFSTQSERVVYRHLSTLPTIFNVFHDITGRLPEGALDPAALKPNFLLVHPVSGIVFLTVVTESDILARTPVRATLAPQDIAKDMLAELTATANAFFTYIRDYHGIGDGPKDIFVVRCAVVCPETEGTSDSRHVLFQDDLPQLIPLLTALFQPSQHGRGWFAAIGRLLMKPTDGWTDEIMEVGPAHQIEMTKEIAESEIPDTHWRKRVEDPDYSAAEIAAVRAALGRSTDDRSVRWKRTHYINGHPSVVRFRIEIEAMLSITYRDAEKARAAIERAMMNGGVAVEHIPTRILMNKRQFGPTAIQPRTPDPDKLAVALQRLKAALTDAGNAAKTLYPITRG